MNKEKNTTLQVYSAFIIAMLFGLLPMPALATFGSLLFIIVLITIRVLRTRSSKGSLTNSHMIYLMKGFWVSSLLGIIGIFFAFLFGDHSIINDISNDMFSGVIQTEDEIRSSIIEHLKSNLLILTLTLSPSIIYLVIRLFKGVTCAIKSQPITHPKKWF